MASCHQEQLNGMYLIGLLDAGHSQGDIISFFNTINSGKVAGLPLDQLRDAGIQFSKRHQTSREIELSRELDIKKEEILYLRRNIEKNLSQAWKRGFLEGCIGGNDEESKKLTEKFEEMEILNPVELKDEELKEFFWAFRQGNSEEMSRIAEEYQARAVGKREAPVDSPSDAESTSPSPPSTPPPPSSDKRYTKPCKRLPEPFFLDSSPVSFTLSRIEKSIERTYSDFELLAKSVEGLFPACAWPTLPEEEASLNAFEWYLTRLLSHPTLRKSPCVVSFCLDDIYRPKSLPNPGSLSEMWSVDGVVMCDIEETQVEIEWIQDFIVQDRNSKEKLRECLEGFKEQQMKACGYLQLSQTIMTYISNLHATLPQYSNCSETWAEFSSILDLWRTIGTDLSSFLCKSVSDFLLEQVKDYVSLEKVLSRRDCLLQVYQSNRNSANSRDLYGYFNYQSKTEPAFLLQSQGCVLSEACRKVKEIVLRLMKGVRQD